MNKKVSLTGITKKGKERVKQHGSDWEVIVGDSVNTLRKNKMLIQSIDNPIQLRWVMVPPQHDTDFSIRYI